MQFRKIGSRFILRIDKGEEIVETLLKLCKEQNIRLGTIAGIGAAGLLTVGFFETATKTYHSKEFEGDYEITSLMGNITEKDGEPYLHLHITFADTEQHAYGGHLSSAVISGTFEGIIQTIEGSLDRHFNDDVGLNLLKF